MVAGKLDYFRVGRTIRITYEAMSKFRENHKEFPLIPPKPEFERIRKALPLRHYGEKDEAIVNILVDSMGQPARRFTSDDLKLLREPLVYAWIRNDKILYVGKSQNGFIRPIDPAHHRLCSFRDGDELLIWPVATSKAAERIETDLIRRLKPFYNSRMENCNVEKIT